MINTVWLNTFCTLVEVGHFTHTAQRLFMTQSGVSQHIRKLEEQLGTQLLIRQGKQFSLSDCGKRLYEQGKPLLGSLAAIAQDISSDPPYEGNVRVMSSGSVGLRLYPQLLKLQERHPQLIVDYRFAPNEDIQKALCDSAIEIGFMSIRPTSPDIHYELVANEPLLLVTSSHIDSVSWEILQQLGFIDHPDGAHHCGLLLSANFKQFQHREVLKKKGFSNQIGLILEPVSKGLGFTVLPAYAVAAFHKPETIKIHDLKVPISEPIYLCTNKSMRGLNRVKTIKAEALRWLSDS
ncbi:LysR family transcriptional regulator [Pseudoalteromonas sp. A25]|uniref:LysR family transcriptional regulator n=1 Tax=Pseudoalteromonas sp. A25 TaxID=116092 RepID=UPI0012609347|nr:LysR family transcriptional regulator [Pseudoalteromonas sp. A25]BBN80764.1 LysR family transcriptional regulator [Pseudoalteromonas sp. A25]